jgi:hypothetical protein
MRADLELDPRGRRLRASLAAVLVRDDAYELRLMREWLNNWSGIGLIIAGMSHQGFTVSLGEHGVGPSQLYSRSNSRARSWASSRVSNLPTQRFWSSATTYSSTSTATVFRTTRCCPIVLTSPRSTSTAWGGLSPRSVWR